MQSRKPKVAYLVADTGRKYGIERYDEFLLKELKKLADVSLFKLPYNGTFWSLIQSRRVIKDIAGRGYTLYHISSYAGVILKQLALPMIYTVHHPSVCFAKYLEMDKQRVNPTTRLRNYTRYQLEKCCFDYACHVIAVSSFTRKTLIDDYKVPEEKINVIHDGVEHALFSPTKRSEKIRDKYAGKELIFYCGRLERDKNLERSILAMKKLRERTGKDAVFLIAGSGAQELLLKQLVVRLRLEDTIHFLGRLSEEELPSFYASADAFLNPSLLEGFGMTNLEAMASGLPVIGSKMEPIAEVVGDCGLLVDPLDVSAISQALGKLLEDKELRRSLREKGLKRAQIFSWPRVAEEVTQVYQMALQKQL